MPALSTPALRKSKPYVFTIGCFFHFGLNFKILLTDVIKCCIID